MPNFDPAAKAAECAAVADRAQTKVTAGYATKNAGEMAILDGEKAKGLAGDAGVCFAAAVAVEDNDPALAAAASAAAERMLAEAAVLAPVPV